MQWLWPIAAHCQAVYFEHAGIMYDVPAGAGAASCAKQPRERERERGGVQVMPAEHYSGSYTKRPQLQVSK